MKTHTKFSPHERELLANYRSSGLSKPVCSRLLNRPLSTIKAEIRRNSCTVLNRDGQKTRVYVGISAQAKAEHRKYRSAHNKQARKNADVYSYVTKHLRMS